MLQNKNAMTDFIHLLIHKRGEPTMEGRKNDYAWTNRTTGITALHAHIFEGV
jgi:hypothetical protein